MARIVKDVEENNEKGKLFVVQIYYVLNHGNIILMNFQIYIIS